jgi:cytochrome b6-f complex iron-sulfur subunit
MAVDPYTSESKLRRFVSGSRRSFLLWMGWIAVGVGALFGGVQSLKFLFPNATGEEPLGFKVPDDPASITIGNPLQITQKRVSIIRDDAGFYAVYLICTHLGCTPNYVSNVANNTGADTANEAAAKARGQRKPDEQQANGWACPCHGSRYFIDSTNFYGPAPRPMDWVDISFTPDGKLFVDRSKKVVLRNPGQTVAPEWRLDPKTGKSNGKTLGV